MQAKINTSYLTKELIRINGWIDLPAVGTSMFPLIKEGDICRFISCEAVMLKKGEIILFRSPAGSLIAHRLVSIECINGQTQYTLKGDTNYSLDETVYQAQIIGKLISIHKGKYHNRLPRLFIEFWSRLILLFPVITIFLRAYLNKRT